MNNCHSDHVPINIWTSGSCSLVPREVGSGHETRQLRCSIHCDDPLPTLDRYPPTCEYRIIILLIPPISQLRSVAHVHCTAGLFSVQHCKAGNRACRQGYSSRSTYKCKLKHATIEEFDPFCIPI